MAPKRPLGLGKSAKQKKKQQVEAIEKATPETSLSPEKSETATPDLDQEENGQQLTVELDETVDPNDELSQLKGLWKTYNNSSKENELMLNGIIHECDRLLRNQELSETKLNDEFHSIYALALSELAKFNTLKLEDEEEEEIENKVGEFFNAAIERVQLGIEAYSESKLLKLTESLITMSRIPLEYVSQMDLNSNTKQFPDLEELILKSLSNIDKIDKFESLEFEMLEFLKSFDDLIDIILNFGHDNLEGLDSEDEDEEIEEIKLSKKHPLYKLQQKIPDYNTWCREHLQKLYDFNTNKSIDLDISSKLGKSYLQLLEQPSQIYTTLKYDNPSNVEEIEGYNLQKSRDQAIKYFNIAIPLLTKLCHDSNPESMVDLAELEISLGNLYEVASAKQEELYKLAEVKLRKLNNITHGKYQDILDNLLNNDDDEI